MPGRIMADELDCGLENREFEIQSRYYIQYLINTLGKSIKHLIHLAIV